MITNIHKRNTLRKSNGLRCISAPLSSENILREDWSNEFIVYMQNRIVLGRFRYGAVKENRGRFNNIGSIEKRIQLYKEEGNDEILVDIANICMCEYVNGVHPLKHFKSVDDGIHTDKL